jgi:hypothetical protein
MSQTNATRRRVILGWLLTCVVLALAVVGAIEHTMFIPTDYGSWQGDWRAATQCLAQGANLPCLGVSKFPLAYLVNAGLAGSPDERGHLLLTIANAVCLLLPLLALLLTQGLRMLLRAGWAYLAAIALSPLPMFYVATGAMEVQSAIFCGLYIGAFARTLASPGLRTDAATTWLLAISGLVFPLYKDTIAGFMGIAMLFLLVLHRGSLRELAGTSEGRARLLRMGLGAAAPVMFSLLLAGAYCWFKYGVPLPLAYMDEASKASPPFAKSVEFLLGSLFSPNGGVLIFWGLPAFVAVMGWRSVGLVPRRQVVVGALALCVICCVAFAHWWATFGWNSWGNRLMVPPSFATLVAALLCLRPRTLAEQGQASIAPVVLAYAPLLVGSAYYVFVPYAMHAPQPMRNSLWYGPACARMREALSANTEGLAFWKGDAYYQCARERMLHVPGP